MNNELRLVAADGELLPAGEPDVEARAILGLLKLSAEISATFHALQTIHLVLVDRAIQSRWHDKAAANLTTLQTQGMQWITDVWPAATAVPQAFVNAGVAATTYAPRVDGALVANDVALAIKLLDSLSAELITIRGQITGYRDQAGKVALGLLLPLGALTAGESSIGAVMAVEATQTLKLIDEIAAAAKRIEERAKKIAADTALHLAKLDASITAIKNADISKPVMEWAKSFVVMIFVGTMPDLEREAFVKDIGEIAEKGSQVRQLGVDLFALANLSGVLMSLAGKMTFHDVGPSLAILDAQKKRVDTLTTQLRTKPDVAAARRTLAAEAEHARLLTDHCLRFQHAAVEAPREPALLWLKPTETQEGDER